MLENLHRTRKHLSRKEKIVIEVCSNPDTRLGMIVASQMGDVPPEKCSSTKLLTMMNAMVEKGEAPLERAIKVMQHFHKNVGNDKTITACAHCAQKIGVKRCAQCPSSTLIRYCSRECQVAHWPAHKGACGKGEEMVGAVVDVE
jgi:hypothetical protein